MNRELPAAEGEEQVSDKRDVSPPAWQRPPFEVGNTLAVKSGAHAPRLYEPIARDLLDEHLSAQPELAAYLPAVAALARVEARAALLDRWLSTIDPAAYGEALEQWRRLERLALEMRRELAATPVGRARMQRDQAGAVADLSDVQEAGRRAMAARRYRAEPLTLPEA